MHIVVSACVYLHMSKMHVHLVLYNIVYILCGACLVQSTSGGFVYLGLGFPPVHPLILPHLKNILQEPQDLCRDQGLIYALSYQYPALKMLYILLWVLGMMTWMVKRCETHQFLEHHFPVRYPAINDCLKLVVCTRPQSLMPPSYKLVHKPIQLL